MDLLIDRVCGGCFKLFSFGIPVLYRAAMNEYISLDNAPDDMHGDEADAFRRDAHFLQSNCRKPTIATADNGHFVTAAPVSAAGAGGALTTTTSVLLQEDSCRVEVFREWTDSVDVVGDDSCCFMFSPGIVEYWSIRNPVPGTTAARLRLDHPFVEWGDGAILPEVVKITADVRDGSSAWAVGRQSGLQLTVESVTGSPSLRCVYPRARGYHEIELTWPKGERQKGHTDKAVFCLRLL